MDLDEAEVALDEFEMMDELPSDLEYFDPDEHFKGAPPRNFQRRGFIDF